MNRDDLKARAKELQLEFPGNISNDKLEALIKEAEAADVEVEVGEVVLPEPEPIVEVEPVKTVKKGKPRHLLSSGEKMRLVKADLMRKEPVYVMDNQRQYLTDDGESAPVQIWFSIGSLNHGMDVQTDPQERQMIPRGILQTMSDMTCDLTVQEGTAHDVQSIKSKRQKRFIVTPAPAMTDEEIDAQKARENARNI